MNLENKMYSHQVNDFWDWPIVFSPKRIVRVLTICVIVALSIYAVLWIAPGGRSSTTLAPLQDEAADSTYNGLSQGNNLKELQYPPEESIYLKEAARFSSKSSTLEKYTASSETSDLKEEPYPQETSASEEKLKHSDNLASPAGSGIAATFTRSPYPPLPPGDEEEYMSICMAVKNQHLDLIEWFTH